MAKTQLVSGQGEDRVALSPLEHAILDRLDRIVEGQVSICKLLEKLVSLSVPILQSCVITTARLSEHDLQILAKLLPAIAGKFGDSVIRTREIASDPVLRELYANLTNSELGGLLSRAVGQIVSGYRLDRVGSEGNAKLWQLGRA